MLQLQIQGFSIKKQGLIGKGRLAQNCSRLHEQTFREEKLDHFTHFSRRKVLFYSLCRCIPDFATALADQQPDRSPLSGGRASITWSEQLSQGVQGIFYDTSVFGLAK